MPNPHFWKPLIQQQNFKFLFVIWLILGCFNGKNPPPPPPNNPITFFWGRPWVRWLVSPAHTHMQLQILGALWWNFWDWKAKIFQTTQARPPALVYWNSEPKLKFKEQRLVVTTGLTFSTVSKVKSLCHWSWSGVQSRLDAEEWRWKSAKVAFD